MRNCTAVLARTSQREGPSPSPPCRRRQRPSSAKRDYRRRDGLPLHIRDSPRAFRAVSRAGGLFVAGRRSEDFCDWSHVPTHAQSRAEIESSRARAPYTGGREFSPPTVLRSAAPAKYWDRFLTAYGPRRLSTQPSRPSVDHEAPGAVPPPTRWPWISTHPGFYSMRDQLALETLKTHSAGDVRTADVIGSSCTPHVRNHLPR